MLAVLLALLAPCEAPAGPPQARRAVVVSWSDNAKSLEVDCDDGSKDHLAADRMDVVCYADPRIHLSDMCLRAGTRIRYASVPGGPIRIEVVTFAPLALRLAALEWCHRAGRGRDCDRDDVLALGSSCWQVRQAATARLRARRAGALRALVCARHHRDPEVRARAEMLLEEMGWCPDSRR